ncbi:9744_t:CDS:2 [Dentiscutata erythropus]|uniref:9744_t:CDS:1 n=1 Tax=Dentiscutata erythropus TaxID=1348616 RepID=A0A9N9F6X7_9GLOM|nr:9744_t:CDS:2 [Dentiscutata erythropus]
MYNVEENRYREKTKENTDQEKNKKNIEKTFQFNLYDYINVNESKKAPSLTKNEVILKENIVQFYKLNYGFVINSQEKYTAANRAFNFEPKIKPNIERCLIKLTSPKDKRELFLLNNCIDVSSFQSLPPKLVNIMAQSKNLLNYNRSFNNFYFEADFPLVELNFERETIKLTKEINILVDNALNNERPYQELIRVFNTFGYLLSLKIILGQKLRRSCILQKKLDLLDQKIEFKENYSSELDKLFILWKDQYGFDEKYLMSINGKVVKINDIEKWLNEHLKQDFKLLQIISQSEFVPLYEFFEEPIRGNIKSILGIDNLPKILMTGVVQIIKNINYYNVDFPHLESSNYHIFAKVTKSNKYSFDVIDEAIVKIRSSNRTGFLAIIEKFDGINDKNTENLQIMWMLIGFPDEVNFYSPHTRSLSILSMEIQDVDNEKTSVLINVPENLPENSRIVLSFEPDSESEIDTYENRSEINKVESRSEDDGVESRSEDDGVEIGSEDYDADESGSEDDGIESRSESDEFEDGAEIVYESDSDESEYSNIDTEYKIKNSLYSYIFIFDQEFIKADVSTSKFYGWVLGIFCTLLVYMNSTDLLNENSNINKNMNIT